MWIAFHIIHIFAHEIKHKKEFSPISSEQCVMGVMQDLGYDTVTNGHWRHCLQAVIFDLAPVQVKNFFRYIGSRNKFKED